MSEIRSLVNHHKIPNIREIMTELVKNIFTFASVNTIAGTISSDIRNINISLVK